MEMIFITSLIYLVLISIIYYSKNKIKSIDNKLYSIILIVNIFGLLLDYTQLYLSKNNTSIEILILVNKLFLVYVMTWTTIFTLYILNIGSQHDMKNKKLLKIIFPIFSLLAILLPETYQFTSQKAPFVLGPAVYVTYAYVGISIIKMFFSTINKIFIHSNISKKKFIPLFAFMFFGTLGLVIQFFNPSLLLVSPVETFITILTYFFIENPDVKMLKEFAEAKEFAEKSNNEKTMFLYDMSQKIKIPVIRILKQSENMALEQDINYIKTQAGDIKYYSKKLLQIIDNVLDISQLERYDFKLINSTYNIELLLKEIEIMTRKSIIEKDIEFRVNISNSLPKNIYGDSIRLKQIINIVMNNAIKYTDKGFIELTVNSVIKHDVCRLIITIEDSGIGMTNDEIEEIFDKDKLIDEKSIKTIKIDTEKDNLAVANSLAKIIGGTIMVSSELGRGSSFTIVLDQKISNEYKSETVKKVEEYTSQIHEKEKIMVVGYEEEEIKKMSKNIPYIVDFGELGIDCLNKVRNGEKYKAIIMKEEMDKLDGITVFNKLKEIETFEIPVFIIGNEKDKHKISEYLENGLKEYIEEPLTKEKFDSILNTINKD